MAGKVFLVVDRESLDKALAEADSRDRIVVAEGAFDAVPRLAVAGARWRLNGWNALPADGITATTSAVDYGGYATTWGALARVFADTLAAGHRPSSPHGSPCRSASSPPASPGSPARGS